MKKLIEFIAIMVAMFGCMIADTYTFAPLVGLAIAWVLWQIKSAIFGEDKIEEYPNEEM